MKRKTVIFLFETVKQYQDAIDYLLKLNINFNGTTNKKYIGVSQSNFKRHYLDLYLNYKTCMSNIKNY